MDASGEVTQAAPADGHGIFDDFGTLCLSDAACLAAWRQSAGERRREFTLCLDWLDEVYPYRYSAPVKPIVFVGDSLERLREFPADARHDAGYQLDKIQRGQTPDDFKPVPSIGKGVEEIRVWDDSGTYRVIYAARLRDAVYVLHAFQKKTQATSKRDIDLAKQRLAQVQKERA